MMTRNSRHDVTQDFELLWPYEFRWPWYIQYPCILCISFTVRYHHIIFLADQLPATTMSMEDNPEGDDFNNSIEHTFFGEDSEYEDAPVEEGHRRGRKVTIRLQDNVYYSPVIEEAPLPRAPSRMSRLCNRLFPRNIRSVKCFFTGVILVIFLVTWVLSQLLQYFGPTIVYYFRVNLFLTMMSEGKTVEDYEKVIKDM